MNHDAHIEIVNICLHHAPPLTESGAGVLAAEALWGAAIHVIDAANHARGVNRHISNNRDRRNILRHLEEKYDLESGLSFPFRNALMSLHNHFYTGRLSDTELREYMETSRNFVVAMLDLVSQEMATG